MVPLFLAVRCQFLIATYLPRQSIFTRRHNKHTGITHICQSNSRSEFTLKRPDPKLAQYSVELWRLCVKYGRVRVMELVGQEKEVAAQIKCTKLALWWEVNWRSWLVKEIEKF